MNLAGDMGNAIGHEIRNPMTSVRGFLQFLSDKNRYLEDKEYFDLMIEELDRANEIISKIMSLSRDKATHFHKQNINFVVENLYPILLDNIIPEDIEVQLLLEDTPDILMDQTEVCHLIINLLQNAVEASSTKGIVQLKTDFNDRELILSVKDYGEGIQPALIDKVGMPFFTTRENKTGLGLAVCFRIADSHNATIDIESSSSGTTVYVKFPLSSDMNIAAANHKIFEDTYGTG